MLVPLGGQEPEWEWAVNWVLSQDQKHPKAHQVYLNVEQAQKHIISLVKASQLMMKAVKTNIFHPVNRGRWEAVDGETIRPNRQRTGRGGRCVWGAKEKKSRSLALFRCAVSWYRCLGLTEVDLAIATRMASV